MRLPNSDEINKKWDTLLLTGYYPEYFAPVHFVLAYLLQFVDVRFSFVQINNIVVELLRVYLHTYTAKITFFLYPLLFLKL